KDEVESPASSFDFEAEAAEINWDLSIDESGAGDAAAIDWGIESVSDDSVVVTRSDGDSPTDLDIPVEIDWDITSSDAVEAVDVTAFGVEGVTLDPPSATAAGASGATRVGLLADNDFRTRVQNDLLELRMFLRQRKDELQGNNNVAFANQFQGTSVELEQQSVELVQSYQDAVDNAISQLTDKRLQQLVLIKNSERYLDRHVASLEVLSKQMDKCRREIHALEDKNADLIDATSKLHPQIEALVGFTKKLKKELETALPALFKGYKVNIIGDVNNL
ncbi:hypothetical protein PybrP1_002956, partial [[Pythium] brassicae (nom. inval.)]